MAAVAHVSPADLVTWRRDRLTVVGAPVARAPMVTVYRRRRAVALLLAVTVVSALVLAVGGLFASFGPAPVSPPAQGGGSAGAGAGAVYVVQPGDTFWAIARRLDPGGDPRPLVARLVAAHGGAALQAGERLSLPASS